MFGGFGFSSSHVFVFNRMFELSCLVRLLGINILSKDLLFLATRTRIIRY